MGENESWMNVFRPDINKCDGVFPTDLLTAVTDGNTIVAAGRNDSNGGTAGALHEKTVQRESDIYLRSVSLLFPLITARQIGKRIEEMSPKLNVYMRKRKNLFPFFLGQQRKRRHCLYLKRKDHPICFNDVARRGVFVTDIVLACNQANARGILWNIHIPPTV